MVGGDGGGGDELAAVAAALAAVKMFTPTAEDIFLSWLFVTTASVLFANFSPGRKLKRKHHGCIKITVVAENTCICAPKGCLWEAQFLFTQ